VNFDCAILRVLIDTLENPAVRERFSWADALRNSVVIRMCMSCDIAMIPSPLCSSTRRLSKRGVDEEGDYTLIEGERTFFDSRKPLSSSKLIAPVLSRRHD
jgi:hypothetical protein